MRVRKWFKTWHVRIDDAHSVSFISYIFFWMFRSILYISKQKIHPPTTCNNFSKSIHYILMGLTSLHIFLSLSRYFTLFYILFLISVSNSYVYISDGPRDNNLVHVYACMYIIDTYFHIYVRRSKS